jgi:hypothetical protein
MPALSGELNRSIIPSISQYPADIQTPFISVNIAAVYLTVGDGKFTITPWPLEKEESHDLSHFL